MIQGKLQIYSYVVRNFAEGYDKIFAAINKTSRSRVVILL